MLRTTAFERAAALNWSIAELGKRSGLSVETLYKLKSGERQPGQKAIEGLMKAFPSLTYRDLFVPANRSPLQSEGSTLQSAVAA